MLNFAYRGRLLFCLVCLALVLACSPCGWLSQARITLPDRPLQVSQEAAQRLEDKLQGAWDHQNEGQFRLHVTDDELTSYLNTKMKDQKSIPLSEARVWLTRGRIYVAGELRSDDLPLSGQAAFVISARVVDDQVKLHVEQASLGPVPIPQALTASVEETINGALAQAQLHVRILELEILEGEAILVAAPD